MRLPRPGFNGALVTLALGATLAFAGAGGNAGAAGALEASAHAELHDLGFRPVATDARDPRVFAAGRDFRLALPNGDVEGAPLGDEEATRAAATVRVELARYSPSFLEAIHLHRVLLTRDLREGGRPIPSLPNCGGAMILDAGVSPEFLRRLVHHEAFHFVDIADDGTLKTDAAWESLNDHYFVYGDGGRASRDPSASRLTDAYPGFLDLYARSAVAEDKAEVFSFLMTDRASVDRVAAKDPVVRAKVHALAERVARISSDPPAL